VSSISLGQSAPLEVRRGAERVIRISPERDGAPVEFDAVTVEVHDRGGATVQSGAATVAAGSAVFTIAGATTATVDMLNDATGWEVVWTCELAGEDEDLVHREPLDVVLYAPQQQVTWGLLVGRHRDLGVRLNATTAQAKIDEAWAILIGRLRAKGKRSTLIVDSVALREAHALLVLAMIWRDLASGGPASQEWAMADLYDQRAEAEWGALTFEAADPSTWDRTGVREGVGGVMDTSGTQRYRYRVSGGSFV